MNSLSFNSERKGTFSDRDILSTFPKQAAKSMTIQQGMSSKEIAEIVSDKVMAKVKKEFAATKKQYLSEEKR